MKHTKGKWVAVNHIHTLEHGFFRNAISVYTGDLKHGILAANAYGKSLEEAEANAKLIASAPELLEALKEILNVCKKYTENHPEKYEIWDIAEQAIKNAE